MRVATGMVLAGLGAIALGCADSAANAPTAPDLVTRAVADVGNDGGPIVTGAGNVLRDLGAGPELTTFSFNAVGQGNGSVGGHFTYDFRAGGFAMIGTVTCATVSGNRAWIGGVIDKVKSDDPADQSFVGTDVWWMVDDNSAGGSGTPDRTTSLLLTLPGTTITAASWCADKPVNPRIAVREIASGNIVIH